ncbi:MAG: preprotein translocase subunit Sec61beta [Candidatus Thermoplasmatota archaeon]|nr:preprotein translocase subunit Sec61beta [Candidatus Thermoplasmatota archaeon]
MPKKSKSEGFHSAAGLIRYFDTETEKAIKVPPWLVIGMAISSAVVITVMAYIWPV